MKISLAANTSRRVAALGTLTTLALVLLVAVAYATNRISDGRHWGEGNLSREYVTIVDHTGPKWPVYSAAIKWDEAPRIDIVWKADTCSGSYGHCIGVRVISADDYGYSCTTSGGFAVVARISSTNNHIDEDESYIRFNGDCGRDAFTNRDRRALACEEEGHMIGLDHANSDLNDLTCMASGRIDRLDDTPRQHDFELVDDIYTHNH